MINTFWSGAVAGQARVGGAPPALPVYKSVLTGQVGAVYTTWDGPLWQNTAESTAADTNGDSVQSWGMAQADDFGSLSDASSPFTLAGVGTAPYITASGGSGGNLYTTATPAIGNVDFSFIVALTGSAANQYDVCWQAGNFSVYFYPANTIVFEDPAFNSVSQAFPTSGSVVVQVKREAGTLYMRQDAGNWNSGSSSAASVFDAGGSFGPTRTAWQGFTNSHYAALIVDTALSDTEFADIRTEFLAEMP